MKDYWTERDGNKLYVYRGDRLDQTITIPEDFPEEQVNKISDYYMSKNVKSCSSLREVSKRIEEMLKESKNNSVEHPSHYNTGNIEVIAAIDDWKLSFSLGNAIKYIARAGKKDPNKTIEDLEKAKWYIDHEIENLRKSQENERLGKAYKNYKEAIDKIFKEESEDERKYILGPTE